MDLNSRAHVFHAKCSATGAATPAQGVGLPATSCSGLMTLTTSDARLDHAAVAALTTDDQFSRFSAQM